MIENQGMKKQLKKDDPTPLYIQLKDIIKGDILSDALLPGDKIPTLENLCKMYAISIVTARQAITELIKEGLVYRRPRHGTFVNVIPEKRVNPGKNFKTIAFVAPEVTNLVITGAVLGLERTCRNNGYHLIFCNSEDNYSMEIRRIEELRNSNVDGAIIWLASENGQGRLNKKYIEDVVRDKDFPFILIDRYLPQVATDYVISDNYYGAYAAVKHLVLNGFTTIFHLTRPTVRNCTTAKERLEGYKQALIDSGFSYNPDYVFIDGECDWQHEIVEIAGMHKSSIACFAAMEYLAVNLMKIIAGNGLSIPNDIGIVGFDDSRFAADLPVSLTTVAQPWKDMCKVAIELLIDKINKKTTKFKEVRLKPKLIIRESSGTRRDSVQH